MKARIHFIFTLFMMLCMHSYAQFNKASYYAKADGKKGEALKSALASIISSHTSLSYDGLYEVYKTTDVRSDGKIWDMYSNMTNYDPDKGHSGSYKKEGDCFNREHSIPQSVFSEQSPMKTDIYHVIPTDGYVNNRRSNYCFGEVGTIEYQSNGGFSKVGSPSSRTKQMGCSESRVFEPNDEYKGDQARSCFYFVTCYESRLSSFKHYGMFSNNSYPGMTEWAITLMMEWSQKDQVSKKETDRIEAAYIKQKNRNPFIDFPGLEQYIWGTYKNVAFNVTDYVNPYDGIIMPSDPDEPVVDPDEPVVDPDEPVVEPDITGDYAYQKVTSNLSDWRGEYLFVYEDGSLALNSASDNIDGAGNGVAVKIEDGLIQPSANADAAVFTVTSGNAGSYFVMTSTGEYVGNVSGKNAIDTSVESPIPCHISVSNGNLVLESNLSGNSLMYLKYNKSATRFRFYKSGQADVSIYKKVYKQTEGTDEPGTDDPDTDEPGTDDPGIDEPGTDDPGAEEPGIDEPGTDEPSTDEPSTDNPGEDTPAEGGEDDNTNVEKVVNRNAKRIIVDITGRRLSRVPAKGIYFVNGRKYVR